MAYYYAKTPEEKAVLGNALRQQIDDTRTMLAAVDQLGASAAWTDRLQAALVQTLQAMPEALVGAVSNTQRRSVTTARPEGEAPTNQTNSGLRPAEGVVATRINVRTGDANSKSSGLEYAWKKHGGEWGDNKSAFSISKDELKSILQDPMVVNAPAYQSPTSGNFIRTVDMGRSIGVDAKAGGQPTSFMTVITDSKGNLVNAFPGRTF